MLPTHWFIPTQARRRRRRARLVNFLVQEPLNARRASLAPTPRSRARRRVLYQRRATTSRIVIERERSSARPAITRPVPGRPTSASRARWARSPQALIVRSARRRHLDFTWGRRARRTRRSARPAPTRTPRAVRRACAPSLGKRRTVRGLAR